MGAHDYLLKTTPFSMAPMASPMALRRGLQLGLIAPRTAPGKAMRGADVVRHGRSHGEPWAHSPMRRARPSLMPFLPFDTTQLSFLEGVGKGSWEALPVGVVIQPERLWQRCCSSRSLYEEELPAVALILLRAGAYRVSCWLELARSRPGPLPRGDAPR